MSEPVSFPVEGGRGQVGPVARALGFAGLLPQFAALWLSFPHHALGVGKLIAYGYGALIASFIGGTWWAYAMRRVRGQGMLATLAVVPSLAALGLAMWVGAGLELDAALIVLGVGILLTLLVDHHLFRTGEAPRGWMALRVPLSIGLGALTIVAGLV